MFYLDFYTNCGSKTDFKNVIGRISIEKLHLYEPGPVGTTGPRSLQDFQTLNKY